MRKKTAAIPVNNFGADNVAIEKFAFSEMPDLSEWNQPERHDRHSFFLMETGSVYMEIDFRQFHIAALSVIYMHPDQVHRVLAFENVRCTSWAITDEDLKPEYLDLLQDITPASPLKLDEGIFDLIEKAALLSIGLSAYPPAQKDSLNALCALVIAQYTPAETTGNRFDSITKAFRRNLEKHYLTLKRPADYAEKLNISVAYLNECVKNSTGFPVSYHIQQRIILEAKRLLYHSEQSLKEIADSLGYDDYPYFSRLFTKVTGTAPVAFRNKNHV